MNKHLSGNSIARVYILIADFAIMNAVVFVCWKGWIVDAPPFFDFATKIVAILANMSLLVAEYFHSTIAHWRMVKISNIARNTFGLSFVQCIILGVLVKLLLNSATLLIVSGHCGQNRPECDFSCSNRLFAIS